MAERQGFEPWMEVSPHTRLAGERLQPARPSLQDLLIGKFVDMLNRLIGDVNHYAYQRFNQSTNQPRMAEGVGFEPTEV